MSAVTVIVVAAVFVSGDGGLVVVLIVFVAVYDNVSMV